MSWAFDGIDDRATFADDAVLTIPDAVWTIAGWVKLIANTGSQSQYMLSWGGYGATPSFSLLVYEATHATNANKLEVKLGTFFRIETGAAFGTVTGTWRHVAIRRDASSTKIWVDGALLAAGGSGTIAGHDVAGSFFFGWRSDLGVDRQLNGKLCEWAKWDRDLSDTEIGNLATGTLPETLATGLVWHARMFDAFTEQIAGLIVTNNGATLDAADHALARAGAVTVSSVTPNNGFRGATSLSLAVVGTGFVTGCNATFSGTGITVNNTTFNSATSLTVSATIAVGATLGLRNVTVTNPDASNGTLTNGFTVLNPTLASVTPSSGAQGDAGLSLAVSGSGFNTGVAVTFSGTGITVNSTIRNSSLSLTVSVTIAAGATLGARNVTATNTDTTAVTLSSGFTVTVPVVVTPTGGQIRSGQAKVLSTNLRRVELVGISAADAARLQSGQAFKFQGEFMLFFTVANIISITPTTVIELVNTYNGAKPTNTLFAYLIWGDFTPNLGLYEFAPGDVDIRDGMSQNARILDARIGP